MEFSNIMSKLYVIVSSWFSLQNGQHQYRIIKIFSSKKRAQKYLIKYSQDKICHDLKIAYQSDKAITMANVDDFEDDDFDSVLKNI